MAAHRMDFVGRKVKIALTDDTFYEGFVHSVDANLGKVTLEKGIFYVKLTWILCYETWILDSAQRRFDPMKIRPVL